jgi:hypothetical protein
MMACGLPVEAQRRSRGTGAEVLDSWRTRELIPGRNSRIHFIWSRSFASLQIGLLAGSVVGGLQFNQDVLP